MFVSSYNYWTFVGISCMEFVLWWHFKMTGAKAEPWIGPLRHEGSTSRGTLTGTCPTFHSLLAKYFVGVFFCVYRYKRPAFKGTHKTVPSSFWVFKSTLLDIPKQTYGHGMRRCIQCIATSRPLCDATAKPQNRLTSSKYHPVAFR